MVSTVEIGKQRGAAEFVGADARVDAHDLPESLVDEIRSLPGVVAAAPLTVQENLVLTDEAGTIRVRVALVDPAALAAVRPDLPPLGPSSQGSQPMLVSQSVGDLLQGTTIRLGDAAVQPVGVVADSAIPGMFEKWVIVGESAADELGLSELVPSRILIDLADDVDNASAHASIDAIRTAVLAVQPYQFVASARFFDVHSELAQRRAAPVTLGLESALVLIAGATLILTMLVIALAAAASAASRNRVVGVLRIIGMTPRQVRALIAWEFGPVALAALLVGTALGIGLPYLVTAVIDLRGFVGGTTLPSPALDPLWIAGAVGVYAVTILATVLVAAALGRRLAPASTLKMGEQ
jgi:putative ABC transport system permease protein